MEKSVYSRKSRKKHTVNKVCAWMLAVLMLFSALPTGSMTVQATDAESVTYWTDNAATAFESGDGTEGNPYIVATEAQLAYMAQVLSGETAADYKSCYFKVADGVTELKMSEHEWTPITEFAGVFDGNGVTIDGLTIKTTNVAKTGFFSVLNEGANVQNVDFTNVNIDVSCNVDAVFCAGTIAGRVNGTIIDNCKVLSGNVKATGQASKKDIFVGGLVGDIHNEVVNGSKTIITNCFNNSSVEAETSVGRTMRLGGILGSLDQSGANAEIINCANTGSVTGTNTSANASSNRFGGIGGLANNGTVDAKNCYNAGVVSAGTNCKSYRLGSIFGAAGTSITVTSCYYVPGSYHNNSKQGTETALATIQSESFVGTLNGNVETLSATYSGLLNWKLDDAFNYPIPFVETTQGGGSEPEPEPTYVAQIGDDKYENLQEAIDAANNAIVNQTATKVEIDLQDKVIASAAITIKSGVTLDLNGYTLDMGEKYLYSDGDVVDSSTTKTGRLKIGTETVEVEGSTVVKPKGKLAENNSHMPVYIKSEGAYMLATMKEQANVSAIPDDKSSFSYISRPSFDAAHVGKMQSGATNAKLQFILRLDWGAVTNGVYENNLEFSYSDELVGKIYTNGTVFSVTVNGLANYASSMKVSEYVISDLGVKFENNSFYMSGTTATN